VSVLATDFTTGMSKEAVSLLFKYLPRAYANGPNDYEARERVHSAATIAGMVCALLDLLVLADACLTHVVPLAWVQQ
jgi:alcohol dehydrogenase class IV